MADIIDIRERLAELGRRVATSERRRRGFREWAPLVRVVGERLVRGELHQLLRCGHVVPAKLTSDADWAGKRRRCRACAEQKPPRVSVRLGRDGLDQGDWSEEIGS